MNADEIIRALDLQPHPEGGWYRETYRAPLQLGAQALPAGYGGDRAACTAIYYLLSGSEFSCFHRVRSDELWHFHLGRPVQLHLLDPHTDRSRTLRVGPDVVAGEMPQVAVPAGTWFAAELVDKAPGSFVLVGCTVAPGFDFADFEKGERAALLKRYPAHADLVRKLTRGDEK